MIDNDAFEKAVDLERKIDALVRDAVFENGQMTAASLTTVLYAMTGVLSRIIGLTTPDKHAAKTTLRQLEKQVLFDANGVRDRFKKDRESRKLPPQ